MKNNFLLLILISIFSLGIENTYSSNHKFDINKQLTTADGLCYNGVTSLYNDSRGYLWIGTFDGLNRYNGHSLNSYKSDSYSKIFNTNRVTSITEDKNSNILIGTESGLYIFNYKYNSFTDICEGYHIINVTISENKDKIYCFTEKGDIFTFNNDYQLLNKHKINTISSLSSVTHISEENYLITAGNLTIINMNGGEQRELADKKTYNYAQKVYPKTLILLLNRGLVKAKIGDNYELEIEEKVYYPSTIFKTIGLNSDKSIWLGTKYEGVIFLDDLDKLGETQSNSTYLKDCRISSFLDLNNDKCWVSTFDDGLFLLEKKNNLFHSFNHSNNSAQSRIFKIYPFDDSRIYVSSLISRHNLFNINSGEIETLPFDAPSTYKTIINDKKGHLLYIVSNNKETYIEKINTATGEKSKLSSKNLRLAQKISVDESIVDFNNNIWLALKDDIMRIELTPKSGKIKHVEYISKNSFFKNNPISNIKTLYSDEKTNSIWVGCEGLGLYQIQLEGKSLSEALVKNYRTEENNPNSLSSNLVSSIIRQPNGTLWVATEQSGVCKIDESSNELRFIPFTQKDGLSNDVVKSMQCDKNGGLWLATNIGLNHYKDDEFVVYRVEDGLPFEDFNFLSLKYDNGYLFFVGNNNICYFNPDKLSKEESAPKLWFTSLHISNKEINPNEEVNNRVILPYSLDNINKLKLKYNENIISIGVDAIYTKESKNHRIRYKLSPLNKEWVTMRYDEQKILFSGLQHGNYTLEVEASDFFNNWSTTKQLKIDIAPPIWHHPLAYILYILITLLIIFGVIRTLMRIQNLKHELQIEALSKQHLEHINEEKQRYFSNISHELKTPLTLILAPLALLSERFSLDVNVTDKLQIIGRQAKKMLQLIDLAHGIEQQNDNLFSLNLSVFEFNKLINDVTSDFRFTAECDNKLFEVINSDTDIWVNGDSDMIEKVLNNLLSNAFKHTKQGDKISVSYTTDNNKNLTIKVTDNGYGIEAKDIEYIFERFYQVKNKEQGINMGGTGIGLTFTKNIVEYHGGKISVESTYNEGATFTVTLPIVQEINELSDLNPNTHEDTKDSNFILGDMTLEGLTINEEFSSSVIFFVEDNSEMRNFITSLLSKFFTIKSFANGQECAETLKTEWPDLIVSDVMMPQMNGYELCSLVKDNIMTSHIPVLLLTACSTIDDNIKGLGYGADSYIVKPFYPKHIITQIESLLNGRKQLRERFNIDKSLIHAPNNGAKESEFMTKLYDIFHNNIDNDELDIEFIVKEFAISRTQFFQKVKAITNESPYELLKNYRLKRAAELLLSGDVQVNEVYYMTGFKSRTHFAKLFKERYDTTPGKYAKNKLTD